MCDTQEHIKIGEKAFSWAAGMLRAGNGGAGYGILNDIIKQKYAAYPSGRPILFTLTNQAQASYGDILCMAGDFYPELSHFFDREAMEKGHEALLDDQLPAADDPGTDHKTEIDHVLAAYHAKLDGQQWNRQLELWARPGIMQKDLRITDWQSHDFGRVMRLALNNPDHFGIEAVAKWERYHEVAWKIAAEGRRYYEACDLAGYKALTGGGLPDNRGAPDPLMAAHLDHPAYPLLNSLLLALRYNAFGDHFLSDLFSSGHMRTPRADLMKQFPPDVWRVPLGDFGQDLLGARDIDLASVLSGIHHDEDGRFGLWCDLLLGDVRLGALGGATCPAMEIRQFYTRGDGHFLNPTNNDGRAICYRAVALSLRDVLFASLIGKDPREAPNYWTPFGGEPASCGARWAALRLVPRPLPPGADWKPVAWLNRKGPDGQYWNHMPLAMPDGGLEQRWSALREYITAADLPARQYETAQFRQIKFSYHQIPWTGTDLGEPDETPGTSRTYYDLEGAMSAAAPGLVAEVEQKDWARLELYRIAKTYVGYKSLPSDPADNAGHRD